MELNQSRVSLQTPVIIARSLAPIQLNVFLILGSKVLTNNFWVLTLDWNTPFNPEFTSGIKGIFAGFWDACCLAIFGYTGNELVAITAWETEYPRYTLPKAVRRISYRIIFYYVSAIFILGLTVSSHDPLLQLSDDFSEPTRNYPGGFIIMAERAGVPVIPHIINIVMIIAALSVASIDLYVTVWPHFLDLLILESLPFRNVISRICAQISPQTEQPKCPLDCFTTFSHSRDFSVYQNELAFNAKNCSSFVEIFLIGRVTNFCLA